MVELLVSILVVVLIAGVVFYALNLVPIPQPFKNIALALFLFLIAAIILAIAFGSLPYVRLG